MVLEFDSLTGVRNRHLRAVVAGWVEAGLSVEEHRRVHVKPYTVMPLVARPGGGYSLGITTLTAAAAGRLRGALDAPQPVRLGADHGTARRLERVSSRSFGQLESAAAEGATSVTLSFLTPTVFRRGSHGQLAFPLPRQVFGHYRRRWNHAGGPEVEVDLAEAGVAVDEFRLQSGQEVDSHRRGDGSWVDRRYVGFTGWVRFDLSGVEPATRRLLHQLASLAPFAGTGANTTLGMGVTAVGADRETTRRMRQAFGPRRPGVGG